MTTTEPSTEPTLSKPIDARALLKDIHARFDVFRNHSPLAIGIDRQIFALLPDLEKKALRLAMRSHTISTRYLKEMEKGTVRLNLDGTPGEAATKAAEAEAKAAEAAIKAEAERLEKLSQLAEKFGRKGR